MLGFASSLIAIVFFFFLIYFFIYSFIKRWQCAEVYMSPCLLAPVLYVFSLAAVA